MIVEPGIAFRELTEQEVLSALYDHAPNSIADELARLISGYTANFTAHVERLGRIPESILRLKPRWPIEAVAMRLATETIREELEEDKNPHAVALGRRRWTATGDDPRAIGAMGARAAKASGKPLGRPRFERCPCGTMTKARALARGHVCQSV